MQAAQESGDDNLRQEQKKDRQASGGEFAAGGEGASIADKTKEKRDGELSVSGATGRRNQKTGVMGEVRLVRSLHEPFGEFTYAPRQQHSTRAVKARAAAQSLPR